MQETVGPIFQLFSNEFCRVLATGDSQIQNRIFWFLFNTISAMKLHNRLALALASLSVTGIASAQSIVGTISYSSAAASVPTLSEVGMLGLAFLMLVAAVVSYRKHGNKYLSALFLVMGLGAGAVTHQQVFNEAWAAPISYPLSISVPGVGSIDIPQNRLYMVTNNTGVEVTITAITPNWIIGNPGTTCQPGVTVLAPGQSCFADATYN